MAGLVSHPPRQTPRYPAYVTNIRLLVVSEFSNSNRKGFSGLKNMIKGHTHNRKTAVLKIDQGSYKKN